LPDLHVCSSIYPNTSGLGHYFQNNGNLSFTDISISSGLGVTGLNNYASAQSDFNNDGYGDLCVLRVAPYYSALFQNQGGSNHWIKITPTGVISNRDGMGAWIELWTGNDHYVRYTKCGESYLGQNSFSEIFGLGTATNIDSLSIAWPSGHVDSWFNVQVDQVLSAVEGSSLQASLNYESAVLCGDEPITLDAGDYESYYWNNGFTEQVLSVSEPGMYYCEVVTPVGFVLTTDTVEVIFSPEVVMEIESFEPSCFNYDDGSILLQTEIEDGTMIEWSNGEEGFELLNLEAGIYGYNFTDIYGCPQAGEVVLSEPDSLIAQFEQTNVSCFGGSDGMIELISTNASGYTVWWNQLEPGDVHVELTAGIQIWELIDDSLCSIEGEFTITQPDETMVEFNVVDVTCAGDFSGTVSLTINGIYEPYTINWFELDSLAMGAGSFTITISDVTGCVYEHSFTVEEPEQLSGEISFTWDEINDQYLATAEASGGVSPFDFVWNNGLIGAEIPITCDQLITVTITDGNGCWINVIEMCTGIIEESKTFNVYPNPAAGVLNIESLPGTEMSISNLDGRVILKTRLSSEKQVVDVSSFAPGVYLMRVGEKSLRLVIYGKDF
jgi:hypothetical protein